MSNEIDKDSFEQIFGHTLIKLADKLINTTNKEENQIIVNSIKKNKYKLYEKDDFGDWVIQPSDQRINLKDAIDLILGFNEELNHESENENEDNENENENEDNEKEKENENENDDETMSKNKKKEIKRLNDDFDKIIDKSKSFEDQIKSIRKVKNLNEYYDMHNYDTKELKLNIFKLQIAHLSNIIN